MFNFYPDKTFSRTDVMSRPTPVPAANGIYFWWFKEIPSGVPTEGCITQNGYTLLYVGISPDKKGKPNSRANLRQRIKTHYSGNAEGSTLRRTLGVLLATESNFPLRRVGSGKRMTFTHPGEQWLDRWMDKNARVYWIEDDEPWVLEEMLIATICKRTARTVLTGMCYSVGSVMRQGSSSLTRLTGQSAMTSRTWRR
ncbi:Uncharacterised protein [Klebsiella pneumoniae]|nr:Uncharacterised protein [Klebsiella pneumoniae]